MDSVSYLVSFSQAPSQRLVDRDGTPYWIEIRRGNDLVGDVPQYNGFKQALWLAGKALRRVAWQIAPSRRSWRVVLFDSQAGYRAPEPSRDQVTETWDEAVRLAESWRGERA
jgi:hypothetical protein